MSSKKQIEDNISLSEERSDMAKEVLGKTPNWMIRSGTTLVFSILTLLLIGASIISYNDVIPANVVITSKNPPVKLKAHSFGKLTKIFVNPNEIVNKGQVLAEIENTTKYEDALYLKESLNNDFSEINSIDSLQKIFPFNLDLGRIQSTYGDFISSYRNRILFESLQPSNRESVLIRKQLLEQEEYLRKQRKQLVLFEQDLELSKINFERNKKLFDKGVISKAEYDEALRRFINDQQEYEAFVTNISNTQIAIANFNNLLSKSKIQGVEYQSTYTQDLENAKQKLMMELDSWEKEFLIISPINGKVTLFDVWNLYQTIDLNETLFTVVPTDVNGIIGRVTLPIKNSGKVKVEQKVIIKLDNYPFEEWGSLQGEIETISEVPKQEGETSNYTLYIALKDLETSFGKSVPFKQEMQGRAEIVVEELTVLERVFYEFRKVLVR